MTIQPSIVERIIEIAIENRLGDEKRAIDEARTVLGADIYNRLVPPAVRDALATLHAEAPGIWVMPIDNISVDGSYEYAGEIDLPEGAFRPFSGATIASQHHFMLTTDEMQRWRDLRDRRMKVHDREHEIYSKLKSFIVSFDTTDELIAAWPEGASYVEHAVFNTNGTHTAYPKTEVNALLGLG
jgi:hypothetical protein